MILATVGTQLPFPRLISALDEIAPVVSQEIVAQIGANPTAPTRLTWQKTFDPADFERLFIQADRIVSHAGVGTILAAKRHRKPIIIMPRRADLKEHRNDHQVATARQLCTQVGIYVADSKEELARLLQEPHLRPATESGGERATALCFELQRFIGTAPKQALLGRR